MSGSIYTRMSKQAQDRWIGMDFQAEALKKIKNKKFLQRRRVAVPGRREPLVWC